MNDNIIEFDTSKKWFNFAAIVVCFLFLLGVRVMVGPPITGDEPHYLIMDYSLVHDRDLSLANNYDHGTPLGYPLSYQGWPHVEAKYANKQYSAHGIGLALFTLPGYIADKKDGVVFQMVLLAAFVVYLTWYWAKAVTKNRKVAYLAALLLTVCYFFNGLAGSIYPDMLISALTLMGLIAAQCFYKKPSHQLATGLILGALVNVHLKTIVVVAPLLLVYCYQHWKSERKLPWIAVLITAALVAYYFLSLHQWFGVWSLSHVEGGQSFSASPKNNLTAMLFDANRGLLIYNPITILLFVGLPLWFKSNRSSLLMTLIALAPSMALLCMIPNWNGSASPTGRYLMEYLPAFIPAIAFAILRCTKNWQRAVIVALSSVTFLITIDATFNRFPQINNDIFVTRPLLFAQIQLWTGFAFDRLLPIYSNNTILVSSYALAKVLLGYFFVLALFVYGVYLSGYKLNLKQSKS
jgi:hypothetical protein